MSTKSEKMLERVRALLAKADGTRHPEEADAFRAKADELMTRYAIEEWQVEMAQEGSQGRIKPIRKDFSMEWFSARNPARDALWEIFYDVARHCRVKAVVQKYGDGGRRTIPVIGMPQDLEYMDMLFTSLMLQLSQKIDPQPQADLSYEENLMLLKDAGMSWDEIAKRMIAKAEGIPSTPAFVSDDTLTIARRRDRMLKHYRTHCKRNNIPQTKRNHQTYRRSFAQGFAWEIDDRLTALRSSQETLFGKKSGEDSLALALRDISALVQDMLFEVFPDLKPHESGCECAQCSAKRKPVRYRTDTRKSDFSARNAGQRAGREADLQGHPGRRMGSRKNLPG